jgi:hypothetical protein
LPTINKLKQNKIMNTENVSNGDKGGSTFKIVPPPMTIRISDPMTNEMLGEFKEKDGLLTFEGKVDDAGKVFVDFICETFKQRIEHLYCDKH